MWADPNVSRSAWGKIWLSPWELEGPCAFLFPTGWLTHRDAAVIITMSSLGPPMGWGFACVGSVMWGWLDGKAIPLYLSGLVCLSRQVCEAMCWGRVIGNRVRLGQVLLPGEGQVGRAQPPSQFCLLFNQTCSFSERCLLTLRSLSLSHHPSFLFFLLPLSLCLYIL